MNEKVENLILGRLRSMRDDMATMRAEMTATRQQVGGVVSLQNHDHGDIAAIKQRLDRIETRLEIVD